MLLFNDGQLIVASLLLSFRFDTYGFSVNKNIEFWRVKCFSCFLFRQHLKECFGTPCDTSWMRGGILVVGKALLYDH